MGFSAVYSCDLLLYYVLLYCCLLYRVVGLWIGSWVCPRVRGLQYETDVKNLIIKSLRLRFWGEKTTATFFVLKIVWNAPSLT